MIFIGVRSVTLTSGFGSNWSSDKSGRARVPFGSRKIKTGHRPGGRTGGRLRGALRAARVRRPDRQRPGPARTALLHGGAPGRSPAGPAGLDAARPACPPRRDPALVAGARSRTRSRPARVAAPRCVRAGPGHPGVGHAAGTSAAAQPLRPARRPSPAPSSCHRRARRGGDPGRRVRGDVVAVHRARGPHPADPAGRVLRRLGGQGPGHADLRGPAARHHRPDRGRVERHAGAHHGRHTGIGRGVDRPQGVAGTPQGRAAVAARQLSGPGPHEGRSGALRAEPRGRREGVAGRPHHGCRQLARRGVGARRVTGAARPADPPARREEAGTGPPRGQRREGGQGPAARRRPADQRGQRRGDGRHPQRWTRRGAAVHADARSEPPRGARQRPPGGARPGTPGHHHQRAARPAWRPRPVGRTPGRIRAAEGAGGGGRRHRRRSPGRRRWGRREAGLEVGPRC